MSFQENSRSYKLTMVWNSAHPNLSLWYQFITQEVWNQSFVCIPCVYFVTISLTLELNPYHQPRFFLWKWNSPLKNETMLAIIPNTKWILCNQIRSNKKMDSMEIVKGHGNWWKCMCADKNILSKWIIAICKPVLRGARKHCMKEK